MCGTRFPLSLVLAPSQVVKLHNVLFGAKSHDTSYTSMAACLITGDSSCAADLADFWEAQLGVISMDFTSARALLCLFQL